MTKYSIGYKDTSYKKLSNKGVTLTFATIEECKAYIKTLKGKEYRIFKGWKVVEDVVNA